MSPDVELGGYAEVRLNAPIGADGFPVAIVERVRPAFTAQPAERVSAEVVVEAALAQGRYDLDEAAQLLLDSEIKTGVLDPSGCVYDPAPRYSTASEVLSVERLHVDFNLPAVDLKIGRQGITWGSSLVTHPVDPFREVLATEPWKERSGVNAVRAEVPIQSHSLTALIAIGDDLSTFYEDEPVFEDMPLTGAARFTLRALSTDWSAVGYGKSDGTWLGGVDLRGTLGVGWWVEAGWHGGATETHDEALPIEAVVGIDYSFPILNRFYLAAEYRYDGTGEDPDNYLWAGRTSSYDISFTGCAFSLSSGEEVEVRSSLGRHYVHGILQVAFTEEVSMTGVTLLNLQDQTGIVSLDSAYLLGDRWTLHAGAQIPYGEDGEYSPPASVTTLQVGDYSADLSPLLFDVNALLWARYAF
jgi:hypothetical protein